MNSDQSIYKQFYTKLILATSLFIAILSLLFYGYTKSTIYESIQNSLLNDAKLIVKTSKNSKIDINNFLLIRSSGVTIDLIQIKNLDRVTYSRFSNGQDYFAQILYPLDLKNKHFIKITKNINSYMHMLNQIFQNLLFISLFGLFLVVYSI